MALQPFSVGQVRIGGKKYWLEDGTVVQPRKATQWNSALRTGDPEIGDQQFASEVIWNDLTGGLGVLSMDEREFPDRFSDSSIWTMTKKLWTLPPKANTVTLAGAAFSGPILPGCVAGRYTYFVGGHHLKRVRQPAVGDTPIMEYYDSGTSQWVTSGGTEWTNNTLGSVGYESSPIGKPTNYKGYVFIPYYKHLVKVNAADDASPHTVEECNDSAAADIKAVQVAVHEELLWIVDKDGVVYSTSDVGTSLTLTTRGTVETFRSINAIESFRALDGVTPAPWIASDRGLHLVDTTTNKVYDSGVRFTDGDLGTGKALVPWDSDIWYGKRSNALQMTNSARINRGPNTNDGLLKERQGWLVDLEPSLDNYLVGVFDPRYSYQVGSAIRAYNRKGWHTLIQNEPSAVSTEYEDDFTRANNASAIGGSLTWTQPSGTWGIISNTLYRSAQSGAGVDMALATTALADFTMELDLTGSSPATTISRYVILRYVDSSNYIYFLINALVSGAGAPAIETQLRQVVAGVDSAISRGEYNTELTNYNADIAARLRFVARGTNVQVWVVNNQEFGGSTNAFERFICGGTVSNTTGVKHGVGLSGNIAETAATFDNLRIWQSNPRIIGCRYVASERGDKAGKLYYGDEIELKFIRLHDTSDNPEQFLNADFGSSGVLTLPKFDGGLSTSQKTAISVQIRVLDADSDDTVTVSYAMDDSTSYTVMYKSDGAQTAITSSGVTTLYFDTAKLGTLFYNVRFKVTLAGGSSTTTPKVVFLKMRYLRELPVLQAFDMRLKLTVVQPDGRPAAKAIDDLWTHVRARKLVNFAYHAGEAADDKTVFILNFAGPTGSSTERGGIATMSVAEIDPSG